MLKTKEDVVEVLRKSTQEEVLEGRRWLGCLEVEGKVAALKAD